MAEKKTSTLAILEILREHSDEEHIITQKEILRLLQERYGINLDRRSLYRNIEMLQEFGYGIDSYSSNGIGYYLQDRQFEKSEVILLCNAVHSSNYIPSKYSDDLIKKLLGTQSKYISQYFRNMVYIANLRKKENKEFFRTIDILLEAIQQRSCIQFQYVKYNYQKQLIPRRDKRYELHPYYLVYANEKTYLIAKNEKYDGFSHYRVDKIQNIQIIEKPVMKLPHDEDPYVYAKNKIYMYGGDELHFTLRCHNSILDDVIDLFGRDINIVPHDENYFVTKVYSSKQGILYLALQYLERMEILEPSEIRVEMQSLLKQGLERYLD